MSNEMIYDNLIAFHPGSYVEDVIEDLNITQVEFAERLGTTPKNISKLVNGEIKLSKDIANKLSKITGVDFETWMNLQTAYDKKVLEIEEQMKADEVRVCDAIDFSYFKKLNLVEKKNFSKEEKIERLRVILSYSNLSYLAKFNTSVSYRNPKREFSEKNIINANVMLELASIMTRDKCKQKLNRRLLESYLQEIKAMTLEEPQVFFPRLKEILLECGVVLIGLPALSNSSINGATKKFKNGSVLLLISDKGKSADKFWFSLIHEIAHILNGDINSNYGIHDYVRRESLADKRAREFFINEEEFATFVETKVFNERSVSDFAKRMGIHPGIVVGRMQNDGVIEYSQLNHLKANYKILINN